MSKFLWNVNATIVSLIKIWSKPKNKLTKQEVVKIVKNYLPEYKVVYGLKSSGISTVRKEIEIYPPDRKVTVVLHEIGHGVMAKELNSFNHRLSRYRLVNSYRYKLGKKILLVPNETRLGAEKEAWDFAKKEFQEYTLIDELSMVASYNTYKYGLK